MDIRTLRIISGGQTGADRAALDFALRHELACGGWCPAGRRAEDGVIPKRFPLQETPKTSSSQRTEWNVRDSDGTVIFSSGPELRGGSRETLEFARQQGKPLVHLAREGTPQPELELARFIAMNKIRTLNIAGPRAPEEPEVAAYVETVLEKAWANSSSP